jgi:hypothetical protein
MDGLELRLGLVDDRRHFRLLVRGEVEFFGQVLEGISEVMATGAAMTAWAAVLGVFSGESAGAAERQRAGDCECNKFGFHEFIFCLSRRGWDCASAMDDRGVRWLVTKKFQPQARSRNCRGSC